MLQVSSGRFPSENTQNAWYSDWEVALPVMHGALPEKKPQQTQNQQVTRTHLSEDAFIYGRGG